VVSVFHGILAIYSISRKFFPDANLTLDRNKEGLTLFIDEAKSFKVLLENFLPQTVGEMYVGMKAMK